MKIIIFGAGKNTDNFFELNLFKEYMDVLFIVDNDNSKWSTLIAGYEVLPPEKIKTAAYDKILVTTHFNEIRKQLINEYGVDEGKITRPEDFIVPGLCNTGSIGFRCDQNQCCDVSKLSRDEIITSNLLEEFFLFEDHRVINKWWHYFEIYHNYFQRYVGKDVKMLEIGVSKGGSLQMWKNYFGEKAVIVGIDIDRICKKYEERNIHVCIGSQDDPLFLKEVCENFGPFDIILDDGSHAMQHQIHSFQILFPLLNNNGVYICEDTHTSYWANFGGALRGDTFIEFAKKLVDELHYQHIDQDAEELSPQFRNLIKGIHFYDSMVVFEKRKTGWSIWSMRGEEEDNRK